MVENFSRLLMPLGEVRMAFYSLSSVFKKKKKKNSRIEVDGRSYSPFKASIITIESSFRLFMLLGEVRMALCSLCLRLRKTLRARLTVAHNTVPSVNL